MNPSDRVLTNRADRPLATFMILLSVAIEVFLGLCLRDVERIVGMSFIGLFGLTWVCFWIHNSHYRLAIEGPFLTWYAGRGPRARSGKVRTDEIVEVVFERAEERSPSQEPSLLSPRTLLLMKDGGRRLVPPMCVPSRSRLLKELHRENPGIKSRERTVALFTPTDDDTS